MSHGLRGLHATPGQGRAAAPDHGIGRGRGEKVGGPPWAWLWQTAS
jgi:hypothetical protein